MFFNNDEEIYDEPNTILVNFLVEIYLPLPQVFCDEFQKGYATEVARALIEFGKIELKLSVIYATCDTRNIPSYEVMEKLGMKRVGFIKGENEIKGYVRDSYRFELF